MLQLRAQRSCATTPYFCIPDNPQLRALRDTIDDRLFKIRHCEDIEGVFRQLPLFELPIDPGLLVQAAAQGPTRKSVATTLKSRFHYVNSTLWPSFSSGKPARANSHCPRSFSIWITRAITCAASSLSA